MNTVQINFADFVQIQATQPVTTSEFVAQAFGKEHKNLLARIEQISKEIKASFFELNFKPKAKQVKTGFGYRETKSYDLTKDGFMLLVMGFTGKRAMAVKIAYIEAFNTMSEKIRQLGGCGTVADTLTPTQIRRVSEAVADLSRISLETTQSVYARLHRRFAVAQTAHIRAADYAEAMRFLGFPDTAPVAPAAPEHGPAIDGAALHGLASMLYYGAWSIEMGKDASEPLRRLGCPKGITMWTVWSETRRLLSQSCRTLETLADMLPADSCHKPYITEALADIRRTAKNCMI